MNKKFILSGVSKSGTTWLQSIIDSHPDIKCHFQLPIAPYSKKEIKEKNLSFDLSPIFYQFSSPFTGVLKDEIKYWYNLKQFKSTFESFSKFSYEKKIYNWKKFLYQKIDFNANKLVGSKSFSNLNFFEKLFPMGKIIIIVRDPRDIVISKRHHLFRRGYFINGDEKHKFFYFINKISLLRKILYKLKIFSTNDFHFSKQRFLTDNFCKKIFVEWNNYYNEVLKFYNKNPKKVIIIKYEDLKLDFEHQISRVFNFLEVEYTTDLIRLINQKNHFDKLKVKSKFYRKGKIGDWSNHLEKSQIRLFENICSKIYKEIGYEL